MTTKNDGGPAFPCDTIIQRDEKGRFQGHEISSTGLSIRDHFAGLAMQALIARSLSVADWASVEKLAYERADAMLAARSAT